MDCKVVIVVGNPKPNSRTLHLAELLVKKILGSSGYSLRVIDLALHVTEIFKWPSENMAALNDFVASCDLAVFASPTYKATYTALLKAFFDRYPANGLAGVIALPMMTGADAAHSMSTTVGLSPLLVELGAAVPLRGLYFEMSKMDRAEEIIGKFADSYRDAYSRMYSHLRRLSLTELLRDTSN